jgi:signal peptidase I
MTLHDQIRRWTGGGQGKEVFELVRTVVYALLIALVLRTILFQPYTIPSDSMEPGLLVGDYIIVSKYSYGWSRHSLPFSPPLFHGRILGREPHRGDIVVFQLPRDESETYIKRLIGLPGDRVQVVHSTVFVNGKPIPRTLIGPGQDPDMPETPVTQYRETKASGRSYVTLFRSPEQDYENTDVYVVPQGQYFFMGDNRDNSLDSRWPGGVGVGFVPAENLVGKAQIILASWRGGASLLKPWTWVHIRPGRFFHALK